MDKRKDWNDLRSKKDEKKNVGENVDVEEKNDGDDVIKVIEVKFDNANGDRTVKLQRTRTTRKIARTKIMMTKVRFVTRRGTTMLKMSTLGRGTMRGRAMTIWSRRKLMRRRR